METKPEAAVPVELTKLYAGDTPGLAATMVAISISALAGHQPDSTLWEVRAREAAERQNQTEMTFADERIADTSFESFLAAPLGTRSAAVRVKAEVVPGTRSTPDWNLG